MPQSANDQVEHNNDPLGICYGLRFNASVGKRSSGTLSQSGGLTAVICFNASVGKRSSGTGLVGTGPILPASFNASVGKRSSGTCAVPTTRSPAKCFNASVGKRSSGTSRTWPTNHRLESFNASVGKRSSGTCPPGRSAFDILQFQCLSRQTIKWNENGNPPASMAAMVSMPQSANDQVEPSMRTRILCVRAVSMPQSANDQVELTVT